MSLPAGFRGPLDTRPDAAALTQDGDTWSWAELAQRVEDADAALHRAGVGVADRVIVPSRPARGAAVTVWAALARGAHAVPVAAELPAAERSRRATAVGAGFIVDGREVRSLPIGAAHDAGEAGHAPHGQHARHEAALLVHTSGTTGPARAVVLPLSALIASADGVVAGADLRPGDAWLDPLPLSHVGGLGVLFRGARVGAETVLIDGFDADEVARLFESGRMTHASLVARMLDRLLGSPLRARGLRCVLVGGGRTDPALLARARSAGIPAQATYGLSEAGSTVTLHRADGPAVQAGDAGWPLPGLRVRIGPGGGVQVAGASLMLGYDDGPALGEWLATGDRGRRLEDGRLVILDRRTDLIVTGGENVSPAAVEAVIGALQAVEEVCVLGLPHASWGQELVALVRWRGEPQPELLQHAAESLAPWQRPRRWIQRRGPLPRTALGKLLRHQARQELLELGEA